MGVSFQAGQWMSPGKIIPQSTPFVPPSGGGHISYTHKIYVYRLSCNNLRYNSFPFLSDVVGSYRYLRSSCSHQQSFSSGSHG